MSVNTTPRTWVSSEVVTAAEMNTEIRDFAAGIQSAWTTFTPTWTGSGSNPAIGNGTFTARYQRVGKTITFLIATSLGSTTTIGTGTYSWTLPVTALLGAHVAIGDANFFDTSAGSDLAGWTAMLGSTTTVTTRSSTGTAIGSATPVVPAAGDVIYVGGTYEAA